VRVPLLVPALVACAVGAPTTLGAQAQAPFEGIISMRIVGDRQAEMPVKYYVRNGVYRMEMPNMEGRGKGGTMAIIVDPAKRESYMLMAEQKMYMVNKLDQLEGQQTAAAGSADVRRTGRTETIAGYTCEHVIVKSESGETDVCAASGIGTWVGMQGPGRGRRGGGAQQAWARRLGSDWFPLKVSTVADGKVIMEVTAVEKQTLDAALFAPPADYQKMPSFGDMLRVRKDEKP
jgi:hypothetical protein